MIGHGSVAAVDCSAALVQWRYVGVGRRAQAQWQMAAMLAAAAAPLLSSPMDLESARNAVLLLS